MKKYRKFLVIPDTQCKPGVPTRHLSAISNYIEEKRPDVIIHLGDHFDLPSLSSYSLAGEKEGKRYADDIVAGKDAMFRLTAFRDVKKYRPEMHFLMGNHEYRVHRTVDANPHLIGAIGEKDFELERYGWTVHPFLNILRRNGVEFSHYFVSGPMGRPVTSAAAMLRERQGSCVQGHVQKVDIAIHPKTQKTAIMAGTCYLHDESYLAQSNTCKRQIVMLHEVYEGRFDPMFVSLGYLLRQYA